MHARRIPKLGVGLLAGVLSSVAAAGIGATPVAAQGISCGGSSSGTQVSIFGSDGPVRLTVGSRRSPAGVAVKFPHGLLACSGGTEIAAITVALGDRNDSIDFHANSPTLRREHYHPVQKGIVVTVRAGGGDDSVSGHGGSDQLRGGEGADEAGGGGGADVLRGGRGSDRVTGGAGKDTLAGGPEADVIFAADGHPDVIGCGAGNDRAIVDRTDTTRSCEIVSLSG